MALQRNKICTELSDLQQLRSGKVQSHCPHTITNIHPKSIKHLGFDWGGVGWRSFQPRHIPYNSKTTTAQPTVLVARPDNQLPTSPHLNPEFKTERQTHEKSSTQTPSPPMVSRTPNNLHEMTWPLGDTTRNHATISPTRCSCSPLNIPKFKLLDSV